MPDPDWTVFGIARDPGDNSLRALLKRRAIAWPPGYLDAYLQAMGEAGYVTQRHNDGGLLQRPASEEEEERVFRRMLAILEDERGG